MLTLVTESHREARTMRKKAKTQKEAVRSATIRLPEQLHYELGVALARNRDTLAAMMLRAVARYLDEQEGPHAERQRFLEVAAAFYRTAAPDVREWIKQSMEGMITNAQR